MSWYNQSYRHSLARKGITTSRKLNGRLAFVTRQGIPITIKDHETSDRVYPVDPAVVKRTIDKMPDHEVVGLTEINFRHPGIPATKQDKAWAQYVRGDRRINVFSQKVDGDEFVDVDGGLESPEKAEGYMVDYVVPHEVAHHTIQYVWGFKDDPMKKEEARADALVAGYNPIDPGVERAFEKFREDDFGPRGSV